MTRQELLDRLRAQCSEAQQGLLDHIWKHFLQKREWISARRLHQRYKKSYVLETLEGLGGSVVTQTEDHGGGRANYQLGLLGALLTTNGEKLQDLLARFYAYLLTRFEEDPDVSEVRGPELAATLRLSDDESRMLATLIDIGELWGSGASLAGQDWHCGVPRNIDDLPEIPDFRQYVARLAAQRYDKGLAVRAVDRNRQLGADAADEGFHTPWNSYTTTAVIGEGGTGIVYAVEDSSGASLALKALHPKALSSKRLARFRNEIEVCTTLDDPHIVQVLDVGFAWTPDDLKMPFYVMHRYNQTLRTMMKGGIEAQEALAVFQQILSGVAAAHARGVWHRDLKPENVLYNTSAAKVVVADFGIAHVAPDIAAATVHTQPGERLANFTYAAPEQRVTGSRPDQRCDIYALGLILGELLTGQVPHAPGYTRIGKVVPQLAELDTVLERMIQQQPEHRFSTIEELLADEVWQRIA